MNPYAPPTAPPKSLEPSSLSAGQRELQVARAVVVLAAGKGQMAVINELRIAGLGHEDAKRESYGVFEEACGQLRRSQRAHRIIAWILIAMGLLVPLGMFLAGMRLFIVTAVPVLLGMRMLFRLPNPKPLP